MEIGYTRVSTTKQDLDRQIDALHKEGIAADRIYVDKRSGANTNRPGLHTALDQARDGDIIVVHTLDRLGSVAMSAGLAVFGLITLHTALNLALAGSPALPIIWILSVAAAITLSWLILFFYRDLDLYDVEESYLADSE